MIVPCYESAIPGQVQLPGDKSQQEKQKLYAGMIGICAFFIYNEVAI
jgi:hypothetical protein